MVSSRPGREVSWWGDFEADDELLTLPLDGSAGTPSYDPFFLVCTHGRHDTCCAVEGRPVAAALESARPGAVWECSHVGGDRFAANVVAMPHGIYYGQVEMTRADGARRGSRTRRRAGRPAARPVDHGAGSPGRVGARPEPGR